MPAKAGFFRLPVYQAVALCQFQKCAAPNQGIEPSIEPYEGAKGDILAPPESFPAVFCNKAPPFTFAAGMTLWPHVRLLACGRQTLPHVESTI